jgi:tRNA(Ile)-lysidine synthase
MDPAGRAGAGDLIRSLLARCGFPAPGTSVVCGVSGGADSTALLALAVAAGCEATAVHVDHGLRPGSAAEADVVARSAASIGADFRATRVEVAPGPNLEARARAARHDALGSDALLGHTLDDQAETILLNLVRGAGLEGLAGIAADARHPILELRRAETHALCATLALEVVDDPSNADPALRRNRVRAEVLPLLDDVADRDVAAVLARQAPLLRDAAQVLTAASTAIDPTVATDVASAPPALARMAVRAWLRPLSCERHPPDAAAVERVLAVARKECVATEVAGGVRVVRRRGRLLIEVPAVASAP